MRIDEASDLLHDCVSDKASKHEFISNSALSRKEKHPNYELLDSYFQVDGKLMRRTEEHHPNLPKDDFREKYFKALNLVMASIRARFNQLNFITSSLILSSHQLKGQETVDKKSLNLQEKYIVKII